MPIHNVLSMIGLAAKSGHIASGGFAVEKAVKSRHAYLVIVSEEASENTKKNFCKMAEYYHVPYYCFAGSKELGHCIGKSFRMSVAITDENLAKAVEAKLAAYLAEQKKTE